ncbi:LuxR C-terminal-related transcriptional regulator [Streptomyces sp. E11-3]|uniref:LuxR C-terminal-related transcriptional regulator n=1 Tax=Streptomyces sp. E11-3 TaxID=3110112 RepID=UPI00398190D2
MLARLGFDHLTDEVYKTLITGRHQRVDELAAALGQPEGAILAALEQLEKLDLLRPFGDGLGQLVDPRLGLQSLLLQQISEIDARVKAFDEDRTAVLGLIDQYTDLPSGCGEPGSSFVAGREAVTERLRELAGAADTEWLAFIPGGAPSVSWLETALSLVRQVQDRGVTTRTVFTDSIRTDTREALQSAWQEELGCRVRTVPSLPVHMLVADRSVALLPADPNDPWRSVMQISTPGALAAITALFEGVWDSALPLGTSTQPDEHELTSRERELLRLLARGLTDDVIRRRLGVSLRTVRRIVADLCTRLQAESRFEAGYQAAKRGWI